MPQDSGEWIKTEFSLVERIRLFDKYLAAVYKVQNLLQQNFRPGIFEKEYELLYEKNEPSYSHTKPFHWFYNFKIYPALFVIV